MSKQTPVNFSLLLASSVHDVKNSLGMLLQSLEELVENNTSDENKAQYSVLRGEASRINHTLIHLLGLYRLEEQQLSVNLQEVYVADFLEEQIDSHQLLFDVNGVEITINCDDDTTAFFDENLVAGIVSNVLVNAAKYTKDRIILEAHHQEAGGITISITDNGNGYPESIMQSLENTDRSIDFNSGSTNLGLYFAQRIASLHQNKKTKGSIQLSNIDTGGGKFILQLP